jgi:hypothetical protein
MWGAITEPLRPPPRLPKQQTPPICLEKTVMKKNPIREKDENPPIRSRKANKIKSLIIEKEDLGFKTIALKLGEYYLRAVQDIMEFPIKVDI